jgi:hypothetical protein
MLEVVEGEVAAECKDSHHQAIYDLNISINNISINDLQFLVVVVVKVLL